MYCVVVAAGSGSRMNQEIPKQFLPVLGKPVLYYTLQHFFRFQSDIQIILVSKASYQTEIDHLFHLFPDKKITLCEGGETRFESVRNGLQLVPNGELVFIHDGARPFVDSSLLQRCVDATITMGHAIPAIPMKDTIRQISAEGNQVIDRNTLRAVQTPQTFQSTWIKDLFSKATRNDYTDEANLIEEQGYPVHLVEGSEKNFKVTLPIDLQFMELLLKN